MKLKQVKLTGFKSFCDETELEFRENGITLIVGPNGCGKSNVADAIRWVLGEQSPRLLRGSAMGDVIFAGSATRKPIGRSEVTILFDNRDGQSLEKYREFSEIAVTRRLYRTGESEYLINKLPCRLLDVRELLMDTGVAGRSYSIVEQGRVEEFISATPQERRAFMEEAAGVMRFKTRRIAAERKLEQTQQNVLRVQDIVLELERQEAVLREQTERAREFLGLQEQVTQLTTELARLRYSRSAGLCRKLEAELAALRAQVASVEQSLARQEAELETLVLEQTRLEQDLRARRGAVHGKEQQIQNTVTRLAVARQIQVNGRQWIRQLQQAEQELAAKVAAQEQARQTLQAESARLQERLRGARQAVAEQEAGFEQARRHSQEQMAAVRQAQEQLLECHTQLAGIANQTRLLAERSAEDERRRTAVEAQLAGLLQELQAAHASQAARRERAALLGADLMQLQAGQQRLAELVRAHQAEEGAHERRVQDGERALLECRSRLRTLGDIQSAYQGYGQAVRDLMQALTSQPQRMQELGVLGPLADLMRLPPPLAAAVGEHLGPYLEVIVVRESRQLPLLQAELQALGLAGVRCVALDALPPLAAETLPGAGGAALAEHVQMEAHLEPLRQALFGAVRMLPLGTPLLPLPQAGGLAGDWLAEDGSFHVDARRVVTLGRPGSPAADILRRRNELDDLRAREGNLAREQAGLEERSGALAEQGAQLDTQRQELERQHSAATLALRQLEGDLAHAEREIGRLRQVVESQQADQAGYQQALQRYQAEQEQLGQSRQEWQARQSTLEEALTRQQGAAQAAEQEVEGLNQQLSARKLEQGTLSVELSAVEGRLRDLAAQDQETAATLQKNRSDLEQHQARLTETERELQTLEQAQTAQHEELASLRNLARQAAQGHDSQEQRRKELEQASKAERQALERQQEQAHQLDLKLSQEVVRRDQWAAQLPQGLAPQELLPAAEATQGREISVHDERALEGQLASAQGQLRQMEGVNLAAPEEYDALTTRLAFLSGEKADLERAMADLETSIRKMNQESRRRFKETFERVNEKFQELFPKVFGGGEARLVLTDSDDPLLAGVDIVAQPPGKKLQGLNLLSGGEKALTAISLIFSFFLIKPSPFCLLDEVDAPLDEANVGRFNRLIQTMTGQSQFIIITHNKRTMEIGDLLYGVTMEEAGVSKIVSVNLAGLA